MAVQGYDAATGKPLVQADGTPMFGCCCEVCPQITYEIDGYTDSTFSYGACSGTCLASGAAAWDGQFHWISTTDPDGTFGVSCFYLMATDGLDRTIQSAACTMTNLGSSQSTNLTYHEDDATYGGNNIDLYRVQIIVRENKGGIPVYPLLAAYYKLGGGTPAGVYATDTFIPGCGGGPSAITLVAA